MPVTKVRELGQALIAASFRSVKITGGEPLMHPHWLELQQTLGELRQTAHPTRLVLRTNLTAPLSPVELDVLSQTFDHIIISVDGDQTSHDARRGRGAYGQTITNLQVLAEISPAAQVTLAATLPIVQWRGAAGKRVGRRTQLRGAL
jgi:uncharacterized protein